MEFFAFENRMINTGQNVLGLRNQTYKDLLSDRSHILLAIQGKSNHGIALFAFKIGVDQPEAAALAFVDRRIGNRTLKASKQPTYVSKVPTRSPVLMECKTGSISSNSSL
jgi:hypothetical protein